MFMGCTKGVSETAGARELQRLFMGRTSALCLLVISYPFDSGKLIILFPVCYAWVCQCILVLYLPVFFEWKYTQLS
jgi:hypothetical protein